jgi:sterol desaturase/sphingolipid hydroxylase (fatty acid hydroxylase superfamily)
MLPLIFTWLDWAWEQWFHNDVLLYGVGPVVCFQVSFITSAIALEIISKQKWVESSLIKYPGSGTRNEALEKTHKIAGDWKAQVFYNAHSVVLTLFGTGAIVGGVLAYFVNAVLIPRGHSKYPDSFASFVWQIFLMHFIGDFFLYWGHRIQHDVPYLWENYHSIHHTLQTPTPCGTLYIHEKDAALQGSLPLIFAIGLVRPHALAAYAYIYLRIAENAINHSGIEAWWLNAISLKFLPFRASVSHHDMHHRYGHGKTAKNYAEFFWVWDYIFGTLRKS